MGLINYEQLEDGFDASANLWNERFGILFGEINGNLDAANLKNGAVTTPKIATGAVTSDKIAISIYIDNNGWTVQDLGTIKKYFKRVEMGTETIPAHTWSNNRPILQLPEGISVDQVRGGAYLPQVSVISNSAGWPALTAAVGIDNTEDGFVAAVMNTDNAAKTLNQTFVAVSLERATAT